MKKIYLIFISFLPFVLIVSPAFTFFPIQTSAGFSLQGQETKTINTDQIITGDITLSDDAILTIKDATVIVTNIGKARTNILIMDNAMLILENAVLQPSPLNLGNLEILAFGNSKIEITNSAFLSHINLNQNAGLIANKAKISSGDKPFNIPETKVAFGLVSLSGDATCSFTDSTIGSLELIFSENDEAVLSNLRSQVYEDFNLQRDSMLSSKLNIVLKNSEVLPIKISGPFERGWTIFADPNAKLQVNDSTLNKFKLGFFKNDTVSFKGLKLNVPQPFEFRDIHLKNTTVISQWGLWGENSNVTAEDSDGIWFWQIGNGTWKLKNSRMNEIDPRNFSGELIFEDAIWAFTGEIFEDTNMKIKGTVKITEDLDKNLDFADSIVTREYPIEVISKKKRPVKSFLVDVFDGTTNIAHTSTQNGKAFISLLFTPENYKKNFQMKVTIRGKTKKVPISLFTNTPIVVRY